HSGRSARLANRRRLDQLRRAGPREQVDDDVGEPEGAARGVLVDDRHLEDVPIEPLGLLQVVDEEGDGEQALGPGIGCAGVGAHANDPVPSSPAGSYVPMNTPVLATWLSTSFRAAGMAPSAKSRFPEPMTTGKTHRWYSSTKLPRIRVWIRFPLPCTCSSGPSPCLSALTASATSPSSRTDGPQSSEGCPCEATYLVASLSGFAPASSGAFGQYDAKIS